MGNEIFVEVSELLAAGNVDKAKTYKRQLYTEYKDRIAEYRDLCQKIDAVRAHKKEYREFFKTLK